MQRTSIVFAVRAARIWVGVACLACLIPAVSMAAVGPGPVTTVLRKGNDRVALSISPNSGGLIDNTFAVRWTRNGKPVRGTVRAVFTMQNMPMPSLRLTFRRGSDGVYRGTGRVLTMPGGWEIHLRLRPDGGEILDLVVVDRATVGSLG